MEEDFEAFVRRQLSSISDDLKEMNLFRVKSRKMKARFQTEGIFGYKAGGINRTSA